MMPPLEFHEPAPEERAARVLRVELSFSTMIAVVLVITGLWLLIRLLPVVLVLVAALFIGGTLSPVIEWLEERRIRRNVAIAIVFTVLVIATVVLIFLTIPELLDQAKRLAAQEPALRARVVVFLARSPLTVPLAESLRNVNYGAMLGYSPSTAVAFSTRIVEFFAYSMGAIFLALYVLIDRDRLRGALFAVLPRRHHIRLSRVMLNLETIVGGYIRGQLITCGLIAGFMFILLTACGVPNALALAAFGGAADVLPYIGALLTIGPAVAAALGRGPAITAIVFVLMVVYEEFESRVLVPVVYGRALRLPSSIVMLSLLAGATLMGVVGALLALPCAAAILMLVDELRVDLPGEQEQVAGKKLRRSDDRVEKEYERRTEGMPAEQAAAIAVELSDVRQKEEAGEAAAAESPAAGAKVGSSALGDT